MKPSDFFLSARQAFGVLLPGTIYVLSVLVVVHWDKGLLGLTSANLTEVAVFLAASYVVGSALEEPTYTFAVRFSAWANRARVSSDRRRNFYPSDVDPTLLKEAKELACQQRFETQRKHRLEIHQSSRGGSPAASNLIASLPVAGSGGAEPRGTMALLGRRIGQRWGRATRGREGVCWDRWSGPNLEFYLQYPTRTCGRSNRIVRSSWDNEPSPERAATGPRGEVVTASIGAVGALGLDGMVSSCEPLVNVVTLCKPKMLIGLDQKVRGLARGFSPTPS